ncbi:hypothetical protein AB0J83_07785 [Actinoplanes sp. NPDC049596]|uniref:hypothetical protein n=1 Tax=unclassified Actinoplanes TaxID=2626549 RepID=UPI00341FABA4
MLIVRHRRATLLGGAAVLIAAALAGRGAALIGAAVVLALLSWFTAERPRTAAMPGFATPRGPAIILAGLAHLALVAACLSLGLSETDRAAWVVLLLATLAPLPFYAYGLWHGAGVALTPAGVRADKLAGSLFIPWSALAGTQPRADLDGEVTVRVDHPAEVTVIGRPAQPDVLIFDGTSAAFVAAALRYYLADPSARGEIGSAGAYRRLLAGIAVEPESALPAARPRPAARDTSIGVAIVVAAALVGLWTAWRLTGHGLIALLPQVMLLPALFGVGLIIRARAVA